LAKYFKNDNLSPLLWQAKKVSLTKGDLCRACHVEVNTLNKWIKNPEGIQLRHLITLSGLFGIPVEELVYIIVRNKPQVKTNSANGVYYIELIRDKYK